MNIFGQGAMFYFLSSMSYFPYFTNLKEGWGKLNIPVRKLVAFLFFLLATFARTKKETNMAKKIGKLNVWLMLAVGCATGITSCKTENKENVQKGYNLVTLTADADKEIMTSYSASIEGMQDIDIYPQVSGYIERLNVSEGDIVRQGEVLFVIDQVPYKAALETAVANVEVAKASLATAELTYKSTQELYAKKVVSSFNLQTTENAYLTAKAQLAQAKAQEVNARNDLSYTEVKSPSNGVIGMLPYRVGALVSSNMAQPLTTVSSLCGFQLRLQIGKLLPASLLLDGQSLQRIVHALKIAKHIGSQRDRVAELPDHGQAVLPREGIKGQLQCQAAIP